MANKKKREKDLNDIMDRIPLMIAGYIGKIILVNGIYAGYCFAALMGAIYLFVLGLSVYHYVVLVILRDPSNYFIVMYFGGFITFYLFYAGVVAAGFIRLRSKLGRRKK